MAKRVLCDGRIEIELPSGNVVVFDYFGGGDADLVMLHGVDSGDGTSPANLDLVVPDPDTAVGGDEIAANEVRRIRVRHHGPTDIGRAAVPPDFIGESDSIEEDGFVEEDDFDEDDCIEA